jgi:hypothetical protein
MAVAEIEDQIGRINEEVLTRYAAALDSIEAGYGEIIERLGAWKAKAGPVLEAIENDLLKHARITPEWPEPEDGDEDPDPLFDSLRDYLGQIDRYKRHQGKLTTRRPYGSGTAMPPQAGLSPEPSQ